MKRLLGGVTLAGLFAMTALALAQPPGGRPPQPDPSLMSYAQALEAIDAAEAYAREKGWDVTILVTDQNSNPVTMRRLGDAPPFTYNVVQMKVISVIGSGLTSGEYAMQVEAGELENIEGSATFAGGVPVYVDGVLIGAVATSGVTADQDEEVSTAGAEAIGSISAN